MSASDNLSKPLFHGTIETLQEGQQIRPRTGTWAWATSTLDAAIEHTQDRARSGLGRKRYQDPIHHGNVYEVEPIHIAGGIDPTLTTETLATTPGSVASKLGFKVKRHIASVLNQQKEQG